MQACNDCKTIFGVCSRLMSVEIEFPLEFLVAGTPVSLSAKRRESLDQWKGPIIDASRSILPKVILQREVRSR
jgi:hypothetical protein